MTNRDNSTVVYELFDVSGSVEQAALQIDVHKYLGQTVQHTTVVSSDDLVGERAGPHPYGRSSI